MNLISPTYAAPGGLTPAGSESPQQLAPVTPKNVQFQLLIAESHSQRARLTMRVQIYPHDTTDSIVTTVKNFFGIYPTPTNHVGVSFEDEDRNTLIARYENFRDHMIVHVRITEDPPLDEADFGPSPFGRPVGADGATSQPAQRPGPDGSRPDSESRSTCKRSPSPVRDSRISTSAHTNKGRSRPGKLGGDAYCDSLNGYSSGDNAPSTTSGRGKVYPIPNTEISIDNIVEGGRRKRAKFESSELPLFAPLQMPASTSNPSVSPARRADYSLRPSLPFVLPGQNPFANAHLLESPQSYTGPLFSTPAPDSRRSRGSMSYPAVSGGILPTPDPTVGSCMSEEDKDVAIQLMRLGEMSNISHGRTSASTLDDTFSGRADATSSTGATSDGGSDSEDEHPPARRQKLDEAGVSRSMYPTTEDHFAPFDPHVNPSVPGAPGSGNVNTKSFKPKVATKQKTALPTSKPRVSNVKGARPIGILKTKKQVPIPVGPMSPPSIPPSRKPSIVSGTVPSGPGEEEAPDLSTKPRCQRCRKSKKGCDRQRPCGRCKDAGLTEEQCISEDEGNGRKGRYGRHMGVPIKKEEFPPALPGPILLPAAPIAGVLGIIMDHAADQNKKRKR